ncbi:MAG: hypothetical protein KDA92_17080, partial [Planctomycetales bacterium]|nr:hypothetical protein [Planctomycetales bacterium]
AAFILDQIDESTVMSYVSDVDILHQREMCQVHFYAAMKAKCDNDEMKCSQLLKLAAQDRRAQIECEYHLAQYESRRSSRNRKGV